MLQNLFTSKTRIKLLTLFLMNPDKELYIRQLTRMTTENINAIRRELTNLEKIELLISRKQGNTKYYQVNKKMPIYPELTSIILKTEGIAKTLQENLKTIGTIQTAFIYGSFASHQAGRQSDIDLFIIGTVDENKLISLIKKIELQLTREINYNLFTPKEFAETLKKKDPLITNVLKEPKTMILGELHEYR
jgi:predicted nucleotidyltransferase